MAEVTIELSILDAYTATQFYNDIAQELDAEVLAQVVKHLLITVAVAAPVAAPVAATTRTTAAGAATTRTRARRAIRISVLKQVVCLLDGHSGLIERLGDFINGTIEVMHRRDGAKVAFLYGSNDIVRDELWQSDSKKEQQRDGTTRIYHSGSEEGEEGEEGERPSSEEMLVKHESTDIDDDDKGADEDDERPSRKRVLVKQESTDLEDDKDDNDSEKDDYDNEENSRIDHDDGEDDNKHVPEITVTAATADNNADNDANNDNDNDAAVLDQDDSQELFSLSESKDDEEEESLDPPDGEMQQMVFTAISSRFDGDNGNPAEQAGILFLSTNSTVCKTSFTNVLSMDEKHNACPAKGTIMVALSSVASTLFHHLDEQADSEAYVIGVTVSGHIYNGQRQRQREETQPLQQQRTFCNKTTVAFCRMGTLADLSTDQRQKLRQGVRKQGNVDANKMSIYFKELWEAGATDLSNDYRGE